MCDNAVRLFGQQPDLLLLVSSVCKAPICAPPFAYPCVRKELLHKYALKVLLTTSQWGGPFWLGMLGRG